MGISLALYAFYRVSTIKSIVDYRVHTINISLIILAHTAISVFSSNTVKARPDGCDTCANACFLILDKSLRLQTCAVSD